jgi:hypothetical protein
VSRNVNVGIIPSDQVKIYPRGGSTPITSTGSGQIRVL